MTELSVSVWVALLTVQGLLVAAAPFVLKKVADKIVDHAFERRLSAYKTQLEAINDTVRFEHNRQMADVSHFAAKKHEVYASVFHAVRRADGAVRGLRGFQWVATREEYNEQDLLELMRDRHVAWGKQDEILESFRADKATGLGQLKDYLRILAVNDADRLLTDATNTILLNEIYISDDVSKSLNTLTALLSGLLFDERVPPRPGDRAGRTSNKDVLSAIDAVRTAMRSELGRGYSGAVLLTAPSDMPGNDLAQLGK